MRKKDRRLKRLDALKKKSLAKIKAVEKAKKLMAQKYTQYIKDQQEKDRLVNLIMDIQYEPSLDWYLKKTGEELSTRDIIDLKEEIEEYLRSRMLRTVKEIYEAWDGNKNEYIIGLIDEIIEEWYGEDEEEYEEDEEEDEEEYEE